MLNDISNVEAMQSVSMEIAFDSRQIRHICEDASKATLTLGANVAGALMDRLADLEAATSVSDIIIGRPRAVQSGADEFMAVDLCDGQSLVFAANHNIKPIGDNGRIQWHQVTRIKILQIQY